MKREKRHLDTKGKSKSQEEPELRIAKSLTAGQGRQLLERAGIKTDDPLDRGPGAAPEVLPAAPKQPVPARTNRNAARDAARIGTIYVYDADSSKVTEQRSAISRVLSQASRS